MSEKRKRRQWSSAKKLRIVLAGLEPSIEISELCRREGIQPTQYYNWKSQLVSSAEAVFGDRKKAKAEQQHGVPYFTNGKPDVPSSGKKEAIQGGDRKSEPTGRDLGDRPDASDFGPVAVLLVELH